jgi:hypothetical protein
MRSRFRLGVLLCALVAMLSLTSTALAKGGGGGGGGGGNAACATFSSYAVTTSAFDATRASLNVDYAVAYSCIDETWPPLSFTIKNESTGFTGTQVYFGPILPGLHTQTFAAAYNTKYTITTKLTQASNGKVYDSRTNTVTTPAA